MEDRSNALISIIMPAKNAADYLEQCIDSILSQTYPQWELIIVNDHSDDQTPDIVHAYAESDSRIKLLHANGQGIIPALQQAYANSCGTYITRMDADDYMAPGKLETLYRNLVVQGRGSIATGCVSYFSETGLGDGYKNYADWLNMLTTEGNNFSEIYKECVIPSPCWMLHREDVDKCGAFNSAVYPEDYDLCFRFYREGFKVISCDKVLHYWRDHPARSSRTSDHYADNSFLRLKVKYFLELDRDKNRQLILWGAGKRSKRIAKLLKGSKTGFQWICNNPNKIGQEIYGITLVDDADLNLEKDPQIIIDIANKDEQNAIKSILNGKDRTPGVDDFFFC